MVISVDDEEEDDIYASDSAEDQTSDWMANAPNERQFGPLREFQRTNPSSSYQFELPSAELSAERKDRLTNTFRSIIMESQRLVRQMFTQQHGDKYPLSPRFMGRLACGFLLIVSCISTDIVTRDGC
jgi:hypothetical protein